MRVLVTGGAGFIGSHIVRKLFNMGHEVFVIDNLHTGSTKNLEGMEINFLKGSIGKISNFKLPSFDVMFHYGIPSSSQMYVKNKNLIQNSIKDSISLFELARKNGSKVILSSSSSVYNGLPTPWKEDMSPIVTDFYTETRIAIERFAELYNKFYGMECIILRLFSVYGPGEEFKGRFANIISQFLWRMLKNKRPTIYGDGTQSRDFIFIEDVVKANMLAMEKDINFEIINVGSGKNLSFNSIVEILNKKLGKNITPSYIKNPIKNYVYHTLADTKKAKEVLNFEAKVKLEEGIEKTIEYYKKFIN
ncbi:MAG: NAD-dependent epimerase/dehydratase family protein [Candidatus Aenigmatarchaeota archaeon]